MKETNKSPKILNDIILKISIILLKVASWKVVVSIRKKIIITPQINPTIIAPKKPSKVLLGEIFLTKLIFFLPKYFPTKYPDKSVIKTCVKI